MTEQLAKAEVCQARISHQARVDVFEQPMLPQYRQMSVAG